MPASTRLAVALWLLLGLFVLRVVGQALVGVGLDGGVLPPWDAWFSGLVPYPWLLASQVVIAGVMARVCLDLRRRRGRFAVPNPMAGTWLRAFGWLYVLAMIVRYAVRMRLSPEERWTGGTIPIVFHLVLAAFVLLVAAYHRGVSSGARAHDPGVMT